MLRQITPSCWVEVIPNNASDIKIEGNILSFEFVKKIEVKLPADNLRIYTIIRKQFQSSDFQPELCRILNVNKEVDINYLLRDIGFDINYDHIIVLTNG